MKLIPSLPLRPVFTPVENFGDQTQQFGRQVSIGLLPDFPRSDISPRRNDDVTRRSGNVTCRNDDVTRRSGNVTCRNGNVTRRSGNVTRRSGNVILCYKDSIDTNSKNKRYEAKKSFAAKLYSIENGISGVQNNPEIQGLMSLYGYTPERVAEGQVKLANVKQLTAFNVAEYSEQYVATDKQNRSWTDFYVKYMITLKVVRVAFHRETGKLQDFHATGRRHRSLSGWLNDARILYTNLQQTPGALETMARYTTERLQEEQ